MIYATQHTHTHTNDKLIQLKASGQQGEGEIKVPECLNPALLLPSCEPLAAVVKSFLEKKG